VGGVRHTYDSPSPNEEHDVDLEVTDIVNLPETIVETKEDAESLNFFLSL
jgi:hypothetical protein